MASNKIFNILNTIATLSDKLVSESETIATMIKNVKRYNSNR